MMIRIRKESATPAHDQAIILRFPKRNESKKPLPNAGLVTDNAHRRLVFGRKPNHGEPTALAAAFFHDFSGSDGPDSTSSGPTQKNGLWATSQRWPSGSLKYPLYPPQETF